MRRDTYARIRRKKKVIVALGTRAIPVIPIAIKKKRRAMTDDKRVTTKVFYKYILANALNPMYRQEVMVQSDEEFCNLTVKFGYNEDAIAVGGIYSDSHGPEDIRESIDKVREFKKILDEAYEEFFTNAEKQYARALKLQEEFDKEEARREALEKLEEEALANERPDDGTAVRDPMLTARDPDWKYDDEQGHQEHGDDAKTKGDA